MNAANFRQSMGNMAAVRAGMGIGGQFGVLDGWENPRMAIRGLWEWELRAMRRFIGAFSAEVSVFSSVTDAAES
jgi:hypothetical protein